MPVPPFFAKNLQSLGLLATEIDSATLEAHLSSQRVLVAFDRDASTSREGAITLELLIDLLARLYPEVCLFAQDEEAPTHAMRERLLRIAVEINPSIATDVVAENVSAAVVVGSSRYTADAVVIYLGSTDWFALLSRSHPQASANTSNPFGAAAAACIGAANVFRAVFSSYLDSPELDDELQLCLLDYSLGPVNTKQPLPERVDLGEVFLVGIGAIGHGAAWALARAPGLTGVLNLIDDDDYDETNPQRYPGTPAVPTGGKVFSVGSQLEVAQPDLRVLAHQSSLDEFLYERNDWHLDRLALAVDSADDRRLGQASLPRWIVNSWTQAANVGVSRHAFLDTACVACLYLPTSTVPDLDDVVATALRFEGEAGLLIVRQLLHSNEPVPQDLLRQIEVQTHLAPNALSAFAEQPLLSLYQQVACAGIVLQMGGRLGDMDTAVEVPLAFQSAMAGLMLTAEIVVDAAKLRDRPLPVRTEVNLLRPIRGTLNSPESKHVSGRCICQDAEYRRQYERKYARS